MKKCKNCGSILFNDGDCSFCFANENTWYDKKTQTFRKKDEEGNIYVLFEYKLNDLQIWTDLQTLIKSKMIEMSENFNELGLKISTIEIDNEMNCVFCGGDFNLDPNITIKYCPLCGEKLD